MTDNHVDFRPTHPTTPVDPLVADGERAQRTTQFEHTRTKTLRLLAMPLWAVAALEIGSWVVIVAAAVLEQPLVESALALVMSNASTVTVWIGSVAYLLVYVALWHGVGSRLSDARHLTLTSTSGGSSRRLNPAFGAFGVVLSLVLVFALTGIAWRRAVSLADRAGRNAVTALVDNTVGTVDVDAQNASRSQAWAAAFWPDLVFTISVMTMLAALAVYIGFTAATRHTALSLHLARRHAATARSRAGALTARHLDAQRRIDTQTATMNDRIEQADHFAPALEARFDRAKSTVRQALAYGQGRPEATTTLTDTPPPSHGASTPNSEPRP